MKQWRLQFPIFAMCLVLGVSRSGYYGWLQSSPSPSAQENERLKVAIKAAHKRTRETYGARRLQPELAAEGFIAGRDRIARLRRELGLRCRQKRKFKATTNSNHDFPVAENLLDQDFAPSTPTRSGQRISPTVRLDSALAGVHILGMQEERRQKACLALRCGRA